MIAEQIKVENIIADIREHGNALSWARMLLTQSLQTGDHSKSVRDCHVPGMDSIVLFDSPLGMVRYYVTWGNRHPLHRLYGDDGHFTVGVHNHRYEICKIPLVGPLVNIKTQPDDWGMDIFHLYEYSFRSALLGGEMEVVPRGWREMKPFSPELLEPGDHTIMRPEDLHTVLVGKSTNTAWMVLEGPNVDIEPLIYSPRPDLKLDPSGLYDPMTDEEARNSIRCILHLMDNA